MRSNPDRARQLHARGYCAFEIMCHLSEEGRRVSMLEITAWLENKNPPRMVDFRGDRITTVELARKHGMSCRVVDNRLDLGWSAEEAVGLADRPASPFRRPARKSA